MLLNFDIYSLSDFFATSVMAFMGIITLYYYRKSKYPHLKYLSFLWIAATSANVVFTLANLFLFIPLYQVFFAILCIEVFCTILFVDFVSRESIDPFKTAICAFLSGFLIISSLDPSSFYFTTYPGGEITISFSGQILEPLFLLISLFWGIVLLIFSIHILKESPKNLKLKSVLNVFAVFVILIRGMFSWQFNSISPIINIILLIIGFGTLGFNFIRSPQLAFILPMKVIRLNVFDTRSGITLFTHDWYTDIKVPLINEVLFSGMLHGLNSILKEAVNKGNVHEIHLDNAVLLLTHVKETPLLFVLVATKTSKSLRKALGLFSAEFLRCFAQLIPKLDVGGTDISIFNSATDFVHEYFPFVPSYIVDTYEVGVVAPNIGYVCIGSGEKNLVILQESSALITPVSANPELIFKIYHSLIPKNYRVYVLGYDSNLQPDTSHEQMAEIYARFIKNKLGNATVAALSYGGFVAIPLAALHPEVVEKLFLIVTAHSASEEGVKLATYWRNLGQQGKVLTLYLRFRDIISVAWMRWALRFLTMFTYRRDRKWDNNITTFVNGYSYLINSNGQNKQYLPQIKARTVIFGGTNDQFFSQTIYEETAKLIPNAKLILFPNYRHYFPLEHMKEFKAKLLPFL